MNVMRRSFPNFAKCRQHVCWFLCVSSWLANTNTYTDGVRLNGDVVDEMTTMVAMTTTKTMMMTKVMVTTTMQVIITWRMAVMIFFLTLNGPARCCFMRLPSTRESLLHTTATREARMLYTRFCTIWACKAAAPTLQKWTPPQRSQEMYA